MANSKEIIKSLQTLVDQFVSNDVQIHEIPEKDGEPMYWHYYELKNGKPSGYGFSSPNFGNFVFDVLFEIRNNINTFDYNQWEKKQEFSKDMIPHEEFDIDEFHSSYTLK